MTGVKSSFQTICGGGGLRDLLYFSCEVLVGRRNGSVDIKLDIGIGELVDAAAPRREVARQAVPNQIGNQAQSY